MMLSPDTVRLQRENERLTAEVFDLLARLQEANTDANALAAAVLIAQGMHDDAEQLGLHATGEQVDGAIGRAVWRAGRHHPDPADPAPPVTIAHLHLSGAAPADEVRIVTRTPGTIITSATVQRLRQPVDQPVSQGLPPLVVVGDVEGA